MFFPPRTIIFPMISDHLRSMNTSAQSAVGKQNGLCHSPWLDLNNSKSFFGPLNHWYEFMNGESITWQFCSTHALSHLCWMNILSAYRVISWGIIFSFQCLKELIMKHTVTFRIQLPSQSKKTIALHHLHQSHYIRASCKNGLFWTSWTN